MAAASPAGDFTPTVVWLTGRPCAGKSTIASLVALRATAYGRAVRVLDGDELRRTVSADLGFSEEDRCEQCRRVAQIAARALETDTLPVIALVSPLRRARAAAQAILGSAFLEVYVDAPVDVCAARDVKGMYAAARQGTLANFTGISSPYEPPVAPHLHLATASEDPATSADRLIDLLVSRHALSEPTACARD